MRQAIFAPPPDWPNSVTQSGSPPNAAALSRTQFSASTRSSKARIAGSGVVAACEGGEMEMAEQVEAMVQRDDDGIAPRGEPCAMRERARAGAGRVAAAMDVDEDGALGVGAVFGRPDIEDETVLVLASLC